MDEGMRAYGLWMMVALNVGIFLFFAFSFYRPRTKRDWRTFSAFAAFIVALFVEMYGFPLTVYLLSGWLGSKLPGVDLLSHESGHLWHTLLGLKGNPHMDPFHLLSNVLILAGFLLLAAAWKFLYRAQRAGRLATDGPYARIRHPQYAAFLLVMIGFLLQWPTLPTLLMFPILVTMYVRLARREDEESHEAFGREWEAYATVTPSFFPYRWQRSSAHPHGASTD